MPSYVLFHPPKGSSGGGPPVPPPTLPAPTLLTPQTRQVFQRDFSTGIGGVRITGTSSVAFTNVQARAVVRGGGTFVDWTNIASSGSGAFSGTLQVTPGWYDIQIKTLNGSDYSPTVGVTRIGVGEVFIGIGQSLMASWGQTVNTPTDDRVSEGLLANAGFNWAVDPQQTTFFGSNGNGSGSIIPALGSSLAAYLNMPILFYDVAVGNTSSQDWLTTWYASNLLPAMQQAGLVRAILWEQGQNDAQGGVSTATYESNVSTLISQSRTDIGYTVPWGIAISTIELNVASPTIQAAQTFLSIPSNVSGGNTFLSSDTDSLPSSDRFDGTHLTQAGQTAQAALYLASLKTFFGW